MHRTSWISSQSSENSLTHIWIHINAGNVHRTYKVLSQRGSNTEGRGGHNTRTTQNELNCMFSFLILCFLSLIVLYLHALLFLFLHDFSLYIIVSYLNIIIGFLCMWIYVSLHLYVFLVLFSLVYFFCSFDCFVLFRFSDLFLYFSHFFSP